MMVEKTINDSSERRRNKEVSRSLNERLNQVKKEVKRKRPKKNEEEEGDEYSLENLPKH